MTNVPQFRDRKRGPWQQQEKAVLIPKRASVFGKLASGGLRIFIRWFVSSFQPETVLNFIMGFMTLNKN